MEEQSSAERRALYEAVGEALTSWSMLEEALCSIYILCVCPSPNMPAGPAGASFWAVAAFDGKLKMTSAAVNQRFRHNDELLAGWKTIFNELKEKSPKRHDLAHGTVVGFNGFEGSF